MVIPQAKAVPNITDGCFACGGTAVAMVTPNTPGAWTRLACERHLSGIVVLASRRTSHGYGCRVTCAEDGP